MVVARADILLLKALHGLAYDAEGDFKEEDHPRDKGGKFSSTGSGGGGEEASKPREEKPPSEQYSNQIRNEVDEAYKLEDKRKERGIKTHVDVSFATTAKANQDIALEAAELIDSVSTLLDFDAERITLKSVAPTFEVNGKEMISGGETVSSGPNAGTITIYNPSQNYQSIDKVASHEIMHAKFQAVLDKWLAEEDALRKEPLISTFMKMDGTLTEAGKKKYPVAAELQGKMNIERFAESDGISPYSQIYWEAWRDDKGVDAVTAVHETLAEISRLEYETQMAGEESLTKRLIRLREGEPWGDLYRAVNKLWPLVKDKKSGEE